jgi:hypothetical protein
MKVCGSLTLGTISKSMEWRGKSVHNADLSVEYSVSRVDEEISLWR